jgi:hypothetical protein
MRKGFTGACRALGLSILIMLSASVQAEPTSPVAVKVLQVRPYMESNLVYIEVSSAGLCNATIFVIQTNLLGGKEAYAAALTALATGKKVLLEVSNTTGCTGFGTKLQSIYLLAN